MRLRKWLSIMIILAKSKAIKYCCWVLKYFISLYFIRKGFVESDNCAWSFVRHLWVLSVWLFVMYVGRHGKIFVVDFAPMNFQVEKLLWLSGKGGQSLNYQKTKGSNPMMNLKKIVVCFSILSSFVYFCLFFYYFLKTNHILKT